MRLIKAQTLRTWPLTQDISAVLFAKCCHRKMDIGLITYAGMFTTRHIFVTPNTVVHREYCDIKPESRNSSLLGNDSVNIFPPKWTHTTREEFVSKQRIGKQNNRLLCFLWGPPRKYITRILWGWDRITRVEAGSNTSTVTLRVLGGNKNGSLKSETVKYARESQGTRSRERLR
jgi:hypothetical protein